MKLEEYINNLKLELTGGVLNLEINDSIIASVLQKELREVQKFIDTTTLMTIPFSRCIDLSGSNVGTVTFIYRAEGYYSTASDGSNVFDPLYVQQWQFLTSGGASMYNLNDWSLNFASWNTMLQIRNTISTDLSFYQDVNNGKNNLYINCTNDSPDLITIEYIPIYKDVSEITDPYWQDVLFKLSLGMLKVILGRIRSRYTQTNALWTQDGETLLSEGTEELRQLREQLEINNQITYPID